MSPSNERDAATCCARAVPPAATTPVTAASIKPRTSEAGRLQGGLERRAVEAGQEVDARQGGCLIRMLSVRYVGGHRRIAPDLRASPLSPGSFVLSRVDRQSRENGGRAVGLPQFDSENL